MAYDHPIAPVQGVILPPWITGSLLLLILTMASGVFWSGTISSRLSTDITHLSKAVSELRLELTDQRKVFNDALILAHRENLERHLNTLELIRALTDRVSRTERD